MAQKIAAGRGGEVDQVVLARDPAAVFRGLDQSRVEVAVAYDTSCLAPTALEAVPRGIAVARAGAGYPGPVHLERFASPARLCVTDEPRLACLGGIGMLTLVLSTVELAGALSKKTIELPVLRTVQVLLSGRLRVFASARDVALELVRRDVASIVSKLAAEGARVVLELSGPALKLLSVSERAVIASVAPMVGAAAAIFASDDRTASYLRDQRRSKAHRALAPDPGAPCDEVISIDLAGVDPLVMDETGAVRAVAQLAGKPVRQVMLGGDTGTTLRDFFEAAALLKSKRVPDALDFLLAIPSRQMLEVLAREGALAELVQTGARLVEPDARVVMGEIYASSGLSLRTCDPFALPSKHVACSAQTIAYAIAHGEIGDPRSFKRPPRVTLPLELPTDDVLIVRSQR